MSVWKLVARLAAEESRLREVLFVAPCLPGSKVRTRVEGLVHTFRVEPPDFEGWGVFGPRSGDRAALVEPASLAQTERYLQLFPPFRVRLGVHLQGRSWLAWPTGDGDAVQRLGRAAPVVVHLVQDGAPFEPVVARGRAGAWWFAASDTKSDPRQTDRLREALQEVLDPEALAWSGLTPEMRNAYRLAVANVPEYRRRVALARAEARARMEVRPRRHDHVRPVSDEQRLQRALERGGGRLRNYSDRGEHWQVEWQTSTGEWHVSAISKSDLTVLTSGICLSGRDRDFDLQSLVGVIEGA